LAAYFFDSSALAKCYINEVGSAWVRSVTAPAARHDIHVLQIAEVEVTSAIVRRRKGGTLMPAAVAGALLQFQYDIGNEFLVLELNDRVLASALSLVEKHELRAYDAVQLAAAVELNTVRAAAKLSPATVVSADLELNAAALAEGLAVEDPNAHP
jgi:uncharacterized protein